MNEPDFHPRCWWCGAIADSREHRVKASELRKSFKGSDYLVLANERPSKFHGPKSPLMLFPKTMCKTCNGARSQPFDRAYDQFVTFVRERPDFFRARTSFQMSHVLAGEPHTSANLARYYVKNFACRIDERGFDVPKDLIDFLNGSESMPNATLVLYKDFSIMDQLRKEGTSGHSHWANSMVSPENPSDGELEVFIAEIQDGPIGALIWWNSANRLGITFSARDRVYLRLREELPHLYIHNNS
ncbi:hypothetical protein ICL81_08260 [Leucobacter sp. cx-328]|uniref:hypothetical protein n=1 Tax=unclassified Leucobacter TaxID=2621730 RepID=UPI00165DD268|nr:MULTISPECIES: hypothetical protein [unclassified Leucobacter]MBC9944499.1 hypothetical protein [Leucobacter sp. cx-328]